MASSIFLLPLGPGLEIGSAGWESITSGWPWFQESVGMVECSGGGCIGLTALVSCQNQSPLFSLDFHSSSESLVIILIPWGGTFACCTNRPRASLCWD